MNNQSFQSSYSVSRRLLLAGTGGYLWLIAALSVSFSAPPHPSSPANKNLFTGAMLGREVMVKKALAQGADPNSRDTDGNTPLGWAAEDTNVAVVKILLDHGADANARQYYGLTPLIMAANHPYRSASANARLSILRLLLSHGAKVNVQDKAGRTALMDASAWGNVSMVKLLLHKGANVALKNQRGRTALRMAQAYKNGTAQQQQRVQVIVKILKYAGAKE